MVGVVKDRFRLRRINEHLIIWPSAGSVILPFQEPYHWDIDAYVLAILFS